jgi:hypothetical protein
MKIWRLRHLTLFIFFDLASYHGGDSYQLENIRI